MILYTQGVCVCVEVGGGGGGWGGGGGGRGGGGGNLNFVCYIAWAPASSVYPPPPPPTPTHQIYTVLRYISLPRKNVWFISPTQKHICRYLAYPQKYSPCFRFIKMWYSFIFLYNDCISNISALDSFQQIAPFLL